jgi:hypothetical protein
MVIGALAIFAWLAWRRREKAGAALQWPQTEATVVSAAIETVGHTDVNVNYNELPTFRFSYRVEGEYYAGRFSLLPPETESNESLLLRMVGRKLQIHYDPERPEVWFVHDERIEGCQVEQVLKSQVAAGVV